MECLMDHIVLNVEDDEKMIAFYTEVLMLAAERLEEYRAGDLPFPSVRLNSGTVIDLFPKKMWDQESGTGKTCNNLNHFCMSMDKKAWEDLVDRLDARNIAVEEGPVPRWGARGTGTSIYFSDPEGNVIEARHYEGYDSSEKCMLTS